MDIYLKRNLVQAQEEGLVKLTARGFEFQGKYIFDRLTSPRITVDGLRGLEDLTPEIRRYFRRAEIRTLPMFTEKRQRGEYRHGDAVATLTTTQASHNVLEIRTKTLAGVDDCVALERLIWSGDLLPAHSYERPQKESHLLHVLDGLLSGRKLKPIQRFCLALRLMRRKVPA